MNLFFFLYILVSDTSDYYEPHSSPSIQEEYTDMKPSLQTFMSPGDTRTVPRRLYKADVNPDSDYRQWATLKQSTVDRCTSDTQLQLCNVNADGVTCESQQEQSQTKETTEDDAKEISVQSSREIENLENTENFQQLSPPHTPTSIHSMHT